MRDIRDLWLKRHLDTVLVHLATKRPESPRKVWEHPLTLVITGFLLTGVLGALITERFQAQEALKDSQRRTDEAKREWEIRHYESSAKAITDFSNSLYMRYVRAGMLKSALVRAGSVEEVKQRKAQYDEALVQQESTALSSQLLFREALEVQDYDKWEADYQYRLKPRMSNLDEQLTALADAYQRNPQSTRVNEKAMQCLNDLYGEVRTCNSALINAMFRSLSSKRYLSGNRIIETQAQAESDVNAQCPVPAAKAACLPDQAQATKDQ